MKLINALRVYESATCKITSTYFAVGCYRSPLSGSECCNDHILSTYSEQAELMPNVDYYINDCRAIRRNRSWKPAYLSVTEHLTSSYAFSIAIFC